MVICTVAVIPSSYFGGEICLKEFFTLKVFKYYTITYCNQCISSYIKGDDWPSFLLSAAVSQKNDEAASVPMASPPLTPSLLPNAIVFHAPSSPVTPGTPVTPSAPSPVEGPGISECVVCMEAVVFHFLDTYKEFFIRQCLNIISSCLSVQAQIIFLPCGHVCCCQVCSGALQGCPLCRSTILQCVRLYHG